MLFAELQEKLLRASINQRKFVFGFFILVYSIIVLTLVIDGYSIFTTGEINKTFYSLGVWYGRTALFMLTLTVIPGILGRFQIKIPITFIITRFRRQFGILVFLLAYSHSSLIYFFPILARVSLTQNSPPLFIQYGLLALFLMLPLFLTSNNFSQLILKKWWKRLHRLVYIILWLVFAHVALQRMSFWTVWIGIIAVIEVISLIYFFLKRKV